MREAARFPKLKFKVLAILQPEDWIALVHGPLWSIPAIEDDQMATK